MQELIEWLESLRNFNIIKHTGSYVITYDTGMGRPVVVYGASIEQAIQRLKGQIDG